MAEKTGISWTDSTFNAWIGCTKVGPGCDGCYAEQEDARRRWGGATHWGSGVRRHHTSAGYWGKPLFWDRIAKDHGKVHRVFCASLADVFDNEVPALWRWELFDLIERTPHLTWQLVTKRVGNVMDMLPVAWTLHGNIPNNVQIIATMVNQTEFDRDWPKLKAIPARVRGLSIEPMLGPITFHDDVAGELHWAIYGGESRQNGHEPRACNLDWIGDGIAQCRHHGIAPFVKQLGHAWYWHYAGETLRITGKGADIDEWPEHLRVREFPA